MLTEQELDILNHTRYRAAGGFYCGDSPTMQELVKKGFMISAGTKSFVPEEYFRMTREGAQALFNQPSKK